MVIHIGSSPPFTIGTDIVRISRIVHIICRGSVQSRLSQRALERFSNRILHPSERYDFSRRFRKSDIVDNSELRRNVPAWLAGRWAAKEAAKKAWGATALGFKDVRVRIRQAGDVEILCSGKIRVDGSTKPVMAEQVGKLSIAHDGDYAVATVLAEPLQIFVDQGYQEDLSEKDRSSAAGV